MYGGTTAVVLLPFGVVVRREEVSPLGRRDDGPAGGLRGLTGRHRLAAIAAGPGADTRPRTGEWPAATGAYPLAPWETGLQPLSAEVPAPPPSAASVTAAPWDAEPTTSWFQPGASRREPPRPDEPARPIPSSTPREPGPSGPALSGRHLGMPIRVPQASLAPQLRARGGANPGATEDEAAELDARSPEAARNMLTLMQQGWRRGRVDDLDDPEGAPGMGTDR